MRRLALGLFVAVALTSCQSNVTMWATCSPSDEVTGTDGTWVLVCNDGTWVPAMTANEFVAARQGNTVEFSKLPTEPTSTTTSTTTTTTVAPMEPVNLSRNQIDGGGCAIADLPDDGSAYLCYQNDDHWGLHIAKMGDECDDGKIWITLATNVAATMTLGESTVTLGPNNWIQDGGVTSFRQFDDLDGDVSARITAVTFGDTVTCESLG